MNTLGVSTAGTVGTWGRERGLTFYEVNLAGHELPRYDIDGRALVIVTILITDYFPDTRQDQVIAPLSFCWAASLR